MARSFAVGWSVLVLTAFLGCTAPAPPASAPPAPAPELPAFMLVGSHPLPGEELDGRLVLYFSGEIAPVESPATFTPPVEIEDVAYGRNHVALSFDASLLAPGQYAVTLDPALRSATGQTFAALDSPLTFTMPDDRPPVALGMRLLAEDDQGVQLEVAFNRAMDLSSLQEKVTVVNEAGDSVGAVIEAGGNESAVRIQLPSDTAMPVRVILPAGLSSVSGVTTRSEQTFNHPADKVAMYGVRLASLNEESLILQFTLTHEAALDAVRPLLNVSDAQGQAVGFEVEATPERSAFMLKLPAGATRPLQITLAKGLRSGDAEMVDDYAVAYPRGPLTVTESTWSTSDGVSRLNLAFSEPVRWESIGDYLAITDAATGQAISRESLFSEESSASLELYGVPGDTDSLTLSLKAGLPGLDLGVIPEDYTIELTRERPGLDMDYADWYERGKDGVVLYLNLNQRVDLASLREAIRFDPPVEDLEVTLAYGDAYYVAGDFSPETDYLLYIGPKVKSPEGGDLLAQEQELVLSPTPEGQPGAGFGFEDRFYYPRRTQGVMPLVARNVDEVGVRVSRMFPGNIAVALSELTEGKTYGDFENSWAEHLSEKRIPVKGAQGKEVTLPLDLKEVLPEGARGVFGVTLSPEPWGYTTKIVLWTDIGLMAHWLDDQLVVFAHDLFSVAPLSGAKITLWSYKNQILGETTTDAQGIARLEGLDTKLGAPTVVVCETNSDYTFLELSARADDAVPVTEGMPAYDREGYDAFLYADRNLYRPGETIHAQWIARTNYGDALAGVPLQLLVTNPQGAEIHREAVTLSELGTGGVDFATDKAWPTGKYTFNLTVPDAPTSAGSLQVSLEDFVPNRIKTMVSSDEGPWVPKTAYQISVKAEQLFGGPATNQKAKASVILRKGDFSPEQWPGFSFSNDSEYAPEVVALGEQQTDGAGMAEFTYTFPGSRKASFPLLATVRGEVAEAGARPVSDTRDVLLLPAEPLLGVAISGDGPNGLQADVAAVDATGQPAAISTVTVYLEREDWSYYVRRFADRNEPSFSKSYNIIDRRVVALDAGRGAATFDLGEYSWGYHRVRVESAETPMVAAAAFYKMWNGIELTSAPRPSLIKLALSKETFAPGERAELRIESPFDGHAVVVLQGDGFQQVLTTEVENAVGVVSFDVAPGMYPNVWAGVTVVHRAPEDRTQVYPYSSFAMLNVPVPDPARRLDVRLSGVPGEMRPAQPLSVTVEALDATGANRPVQVTVAAVDEGIHGILDYTNPDPWNHLQRFRSPDHRRAHYYDRVAYDFDAASIGGDLASRLAKRGATIGENWIKPVALWSGPVRTDADGKATISLAVPEFTGQLRVVAVAADASATGAATTSVLVRRPFMLQTSMPRFALPGDTFDARATIFNTTPANVTAKVLWSPGGALIASPGEQALEVPSQGNAGALARIQAGNAPGQGQIDWRLEVDGAPDDSVTQVAPLPVRLPVAYQSERELLVLKPGEKRTITNEGYAEDELASIEVTLGADPALRVYNALRYLIEYPHGCLEQTVSALFPLYMLRNSTALLENVLPDQRRIEAYLKSGVERILSMQVTAGGLGYWPGAREANRYGSVYALHLLSLLQRDRFMELPETALDRLQQYVRRLANDTTDSSSSGLYLRAYAHFALALGGDQEALEQLGRFDAIPLPEAARYLLAAALAANSGDAARATEYLASRPIATFDDFERGGTLNSAIRSDAVKLLALAQMNAPEEEMSPHVLRLTAYLEQKSFGNTQEAAFAAASLGAYLQRLGEKLDGGSGRLISPTGEETFTGRDLLTRRHDGPGGQFMVENSGSGMIYINVSRSGLPITPATESVSEGGMSLERAITTLDGAPVPAEGYRQGESYLVALSLKGLAGLENVVISDLLPAGFEIENPRLDANVLAMAKVEGMATPSYLDIRDDRLVLAFDRLPGSDTRYYYVVRAVTPGRFTHPGATAECMYDPAFRAGTVSGVIEISAP